MRRNQAHKVASPAIKRARLRLEFRREAIEVSSPLRIYCDLATTDVAQGSGARSGARVRHRRVADLRLVQRGRVGIGDRAAVGRDCPSDPATADDCH